MEEQQELKGQVSQEQIDIWKRQHGSVLAIKSNGKICYLKNATKNVASRAMSFDESQSMDCAEMLLNNCWLGGCEDFKTNDYDFMSIASKLDEVLKYGEAELKKL
ncbi:MAG: hypothetical protein LBR17_08455 [Bacteroidales bacterium]|jgi:hypothetical protein|nr:hypothetical protein [Bacteroidales bacterium]